MTPWHATLTETRHVIDARALADVLGARCLEDNGKAHQMPAEQQSTEGPAGREISSPVVHPPIIVVMTSPPRAIVNFQ
jgi:hypothetical protein